METLSGTDAARQSHTHRDRAQTHGAVVAICGLHGGAGTTTVAVELASARAVLAHGRVFLADAGHVGGLAAHLGQETRVSLADLADARARGIVPAGSLYARDGVTVCAPAACPAPEPIDMALRDLLDAARAEQTLTVIDAGSVGSPAFDAAELADRVIWVADARRDLRVAAAVLSSPAASAARSVRTQGLVLCDPTGDAAARPDATPLLSIVSPAVSVSRLHGLAGNAPIRELAHGLLLELLR